MRESWLLLTCLSAGSSSLLSQLLDIRNHGIHALQSVEIGTHGRSSSGIFSRTEPPVTPKETALDLRLHIARPTTDPTRTHFIDLPRQFEEFAGRNSTNKAHPSANNLQQGTRLGILAFGDDVVLKRRMSTPLRG